MTEQPPPATADWTRVDRAMENAREQLRTSTTEEEYQTVGLLCREALISSAQIVFNPARHKTEDKVEPSSTDAKRMLTDYFATELSGSSNQEARRHARASVDLAVALQHNRTAGYRDAALCLEATTSVLNMVSILEGRSESERRLPSDIEPFKIPRISEPALQLVIDHYRKLGEEACLPLMEEKDVRLEAGYTLAYYPGTRREIWVGHVGGRFEHILMLKPRGSK
jgi:hypothetical protein